MAYKYKDGKWAEAKPTKRRGESATSILDARIIELENALADRDARIIELENALGALKADSGK